MSESNPPPDIAAVLGRANALAARSNSTDQTLADAATRQDISDRAQLAATVSTVFLICLPVSLLALLVLSFVRAEAAAPAVAAIVELLKAVLLPIVTLVLGYYFARGRG